MKICQENLKSDNRLFKVYYLYIFIMIINFFLTPNPYSAYHSGRAGYGASVMSSEFFISTLYIILFSLLIVSIYKGIYMYNSLIVIAISFMIISGLLTQTIVSNSVTYLYNFISIMLVTSIALLDYSNRQSNNLNYIKLAKILVFLLVFGIVLAILFPSRYGELPLKFSRVSRGEVTLWNVIGLHTILPSLSIVIYKKYKIKKYIYASIFMSIVILSTATRSLFIISILPFIIMFIFSSKLRKKFFIILVTTFIPIIFIILVTNFDALKSMDINNVLNDITNSRWDLWKFYYELFKQHSIFGVGGASLTRYSSYLGIAKSEIGILIWFSEYGIFFGTIMIIVLLRAIYGAIKNLNNIERITYLELLISLIFLSLLPDVIQSYSRVLNINDFIFWYCMIFLLGKSRFRYGIHLFKSKVIKLKI